MLKKRYASLAIASILVLTLVVTGGTFALFTNSGTNANNAFQAGTVAIDLERHGDDPIQGPMFYTADSHDGILPYDVETSHSPSGDALGGWAPGDTVTRSLNVVNKGSLDVRVDGIRASVNTAGLQPGDAAYEEFVDKMTITVTNTTDNKSIYSGSLRSMIKEDGWIEIKPYTVITTSTSKNFAFNAHLDVTASNRIQGQDFVFDFSFHASQLRNNEVAEGGTLIGKVHDINNNAVENAVVQLVGGNSVTTNKRGMYSIPLPEGTYSIQVTANGFQTQNVSGIKVLNGVVKTENIKLSGIDAPPNSEWINGKVVIKGTQTGLKDVRIESTNQATGQTYIAFSRNNGAFTLIIPKGNYDVKVVKDGYITAEVQDVAVTTSWEVISKLSGIQIELE